MGKTRKFSMFKVQRFPVVCSLCILYSNLYNLDGKLKVLRNELDNNVFAPYITGWLITGSVGGPEPKTVGERSGSELSYQLA